MRTAIAGIGEGELRRIEYPNAIYDEDTGERVSDGEVAETAFTVFVSRRKDEHVSCRLVVRRMNGSARTPSTGRHPCSTRFGSTRSSPTAR